MSDPSLVEFTQANPVFLAPGIHWIDHETDIEQVEVSIDGDLWESPSIPATTRLRQHAGGVYIRPSDPAVTMRTRLSE